MRTLEYKGQSIEFDHDPTQQDIDQAVAYVDSLGSTMSRGEAVGKGFLKSVLDYSSQWNRLFGREGSKTARGLTLDEESQLAATKDMSQAFEQHPWSTGLGAAGGQLATTLATPGTIAPGLGPIASQVIPRLGVAAGMGASSTGARKTELMEGDPIKREAAEDAALTGGMTDALLTGILPAGIATSKAGLGSAILQRAGTGASFNYLAGAAGDVAQNIEADPSLQQVDPFSMDRRTVDLISGGVLGPVMGTTMGKLNSDIKERAVRGVDPELDAALRNPELNDFNGKYDPQNLEWEADVKARRYDAAETQIVRFRDQIKHVERQMDDPHVDVELLTKQKDLYQEGIRRAESVLSGKPVIEKIKPRLHVFYREDESKHVAGMRRDADGNEFIYINKPLLDKMWDDGIENYIRNSPQKLAMVEDVFRVTPKDFASLFKTKDDLVDFLIKHEESHINNKDRLKYPRDAAGKLNDMAKDAIDIEARATLQALTPDQGYALSRIKKFRTRRERITQAGDVDKRVSVPKLLDEIAQKEKIVDKEKKAAYAKAQATGGEPEYVPSVAERVVSEEFTVNDKDIASNKDPDARGLKAFAQAMRSAVGEGFNHYFGGDQKASIYFDSPVIKYAWSVIKQAYDSSRNLMHNLLDGIPDKQLWLEDNKGFKRQQAGNSPRQMLQKSTDMDVADVMGVFEKGYGKLDYDLNLIQNGSHLSDHQKALYNTLTLLFRRQHQAATEHGVKLNKGKIIPDVPGWYPSVRRGDFGVNIRLNNSNLVNSLDITNGVDLSNIVYTEFFTSKVQAEDFIRFINKTKTDKNFTVELMDLSKVPRDSQFDLNNFLQEAQSRLYANKKEINGETIAQTMKELHDQYIVRGGTLGSHQKYRVNVPGYAGSAIFESKVAAGRNFKKAIISSVEDYTRVMRKMEIGTRLEQILNDPRLKERPHLLRHVQFMQDYALNKNFSFGGWPTARNAIKNLQYRVTGKPVELSATNRVLGLINHAMYIDLLMSRLTFHVSQYIQPHWAIREVLKVNPADVATSYARAWEHIGKYHAKGFKGLDSDVADFIYYGTQYRPDSVSPQFVNDVDSFFKESHLFDPGKVEKGAKLLTLETPAGFADSWSRFATALWMYEALKNKGLKGEKLFKEAWDATDRNMVRYERSNKAPMFDEMGAVGQMLSPMATFPRAALGNFVADVRYWYKNPKSKSTDWLIDALPAMGTVAISALLVGAPSSILVSEYEFFARTYNFVASKMGWEGRIPTVYEWLFDNVEDKTTSEIARHGIVSGATLWLDPSGQGLDIGQSNRYHTFLEGLEQANADWLDAMPGVSWLADQIGHGATIAKRMAGSTTVSNADLRNAVLGSVLATPGAGFDALADMTLFDANTRKENPDKAGRMFDEQTKMDILALGLGTKTIQNRTDSEIYRMQQQRLKPLTERRSKLLESLYDEVSTKGKSERLQKIMEDLKEVGITPDELKRRMQNEAWERNVPQGMRQFVGKSGKMSPAQQRLYQDYLKYYNKNPMEQ